MCQRSRSFVDSFICYKQKYEVWSRLVWATLYTAAQHRTSTYVQQ